MSWLGGIIHSVSGVVSHLGIPGVSQIAGVVNTITGGAPPSPVPGLSNIGFQPVNSMGPGTAVVRGPSFQGPSFYAGPGGVGFSGPSYSGPSASLTMGSGGQVPKGYHINRALVAVDGQHGRITPSKQRRASQVVQQVVKNRHTNPLNFRALRRADRRAHHFLRLASRVTRHYTPKKPKGKAYVHFKRRAK